MKFFLLVLAVSLWETCLPGQINEPVSTEGYLSEFSRVMPRAERHVVPLGLNFSDESHLDSWPVTFGVPFPRGALAEVEQIRVVDHSGNEVPLQLQRTATWDGPEGDVKWVLLDMLAMRGESYFLEFGTEVTPLEPVKGLMVKEDAAGIEIDTGAMRMRFNHKSGDLVSGAWLNGKQMLKGGSPMYLVDQEGRRYEATGDIQEHRVLEENGPLRAVVRSEGVYLDAEGRVFCRYITRVHLFAGQSFVRVFHTLIITFDTDHYQLRDIAIPLPLADGPAERAVFQAGIGPDAPVVEAAPGSTLIQDTARSFRVYDTRGSRPALIADGERSGAWVQLLSASGGVSLGLARVWQDFAKELEALPGGIVAHLWPSRGIAPLDLSARGQLGPRFEEWGRDQIYHEGWYKGGLDLYDQAFGLAKTNELIIALSDADDEAVAKSRAQAATLEAMPFMYADPAWMTASNAFGPLSPRNVDAFPLMEGAYDAAFSHLEYLQETIWNHAGHIGNYGFFDFGDVNYRTGLRAGGTRWEPIPWRRMASRFYGITVMPWIHFARSGDRRFLEWAMANARHVMDIDMCHETNLEIDPRFPKLAGGRYGGNGGIIHYAGNLYGIGPDSHVKPWLYYYYLTGYRRAWDVMKMEGEYHLDNLASGNLLRVYAHRTTGGALRTMVDLWEATWDERYLEMAERLAEILYQAAENNPDGLTRGDDVYMYPGMIAYFQATGDARMADLFLNNMAHDRQWRVADGDPRAFSGLGPSTAYYMTGDPSFLARPLFQAEQFARDLDYGENPLFYGMPRGRWAMPHITLQLLYGPYLQAALETLDEPLLPQGDLVGTTDEIWVEKSDLNAIDLDVFWSILSRPFHWGATVREWPAYAHHNQPRARMIALDEAGKEVASREIVFADLVQLPHRNQEYPFSGKVTLTLPEGGTGLYRIRMEGAEAFPARIALMSDQVLPFVLPTHTGRLAHGHAYCFQTERDATLLTVDYRLSGPVRSDLTVALSDPEGRVVREAILTRSEILSPAWQTWEVPLESGQQGKLWSIAITPHVPELQDVQFRFQGASNWVSPRPEVFFVPYLVPPPDEDRVAAIPEQIQGQILLAQPGSPYVIHPGQLSGAQTSTSHPGEGRLSFWLNPQWAEDDFGTRTIMSWGVMRLIRQSNLNTLLELGGTRIQSGFSFQPGHWYHVSIAWDLGEKPMLSLEVDGVLLQNASSQALRGTAGWAGQDLVFGDEAPLLLANPVVKLPN